MVVCTSMKSSEDSRRRAAVLATTLPIVTCVVLTPAAAATAAMKAARTGLLGSLKLVTDVLSVTTAVIFLVYEHLKPASHLQCKSEELPAAETVLTGQDLMLVEFEQYEFAWQRGQSMDLEISREYLPVKHTRQSDIAPLPVSGLYVPA